MHFNAKIGWIGAIGILLGLPLSSVAYCQLTTPASPHAIEIDQESSGVFNSLKDSINALPTIERAKTESLIERDLNATPGATTTLGPVANSASDLLSAGPSNLSLNQRMIAVRAMIQARNENVQQVVIPGVVASPATVQGLDGAVTALNHLVPTGNLLAAGSLGPLLQKYKSIGRLLWTKPALIASGTPMWQLAGTVFVTSPGIVTTACHTLMGQGDQALVDIQGSAITLRSDLVLRVEFGNTSDFQTMYTVSGIAAVSGQAGCDVAQLKIVGADDIPPLKIAAKDNVARRVLVVGYPLLNNYSSFMCGLNLGGATEQQFCVFHAANPTVAKVVSPGNVFTWETHDGVSVFTHGAPTDGGQSGSPVFDADTLDVIGVHYCCSGASQNSSNLVCATWHPQNISWNEAIASITIVSDALLKPNFSDIDQSTTSFLLVPWTDIDQGESARTTRLHHAPLQTALIPETYSPVVKTNE
jgi:Trypsin-like peptidase domain